MIEWILLASILSNIVLALLAIRHAQSESPRIVEIAERAFAYLKPEAAKVDESLKQHREIFDIEKTVYEKNLKGKKEPKKESAMIVDQDTGHKIEILDVM